MVLNTELVPIQRLRCDNPCGELILAMLEDMRIYDYSKI